MNLKEARSSLGAFMFRIWRALACTLPAGRIEAFGAGSGRIGSILVVNLDRQPKRWRRVLREIGRFRTSDGLPLVSITRRLAAVDARDGRAVAATADVDPLYRMGDQLFVQPDARLEECFGVDEPIRMTRQEVAVARSHIEAWKAIAAGPDEYVLVFEDDIWFRRGAAFAIDRGWRAALRHSRSEGGPRLLYLSYKDASGTRRVDAGEVLFRPLRGLWFLSGYVLSRDGAAALLRAMPVVGPVDLWINYRFRELGALALSSPAILQREDGRSDNAYSVLPYLARAGIVDAGAGPMRPVRAPSGLILAWTTGGRRESLSMALSMLGLRVVAYDDDGAKFTPAQLRDICATFDALVDPPLTPEALSAAIARRDVKFILEAGAERRAAVPLERLPQSRTAILGGEGPQSASWRPICELVGLIEPAQAFPVGAPPGWRTFRDDRPAAAETASPAGDELPELDDSPWVLPAQCQWRPRAVTGTRRPPAGERIVDVAMDRATPLFPALVETFPGNLASFALDGIAHDASGTRLVVSRSPRGNRPFRSGAFASAQSYLHGRFEAEMKAAPGAGLVTGFFLHRDLPRQEIDIELPGNDPHRMLANVYFNPGDDGAAIAFGYRGSPCRIDLDFDATQDFHIYTIDWRPGYVGWSVDGRTIHERVGWDPTPVPHLAMRLHANLWVPRSEDLAGRINDDALPACATFRRVSVWT